WSQATNRWRLLRSSQSRKTLFTSAAVAQRLDLASHGSSTNVSKPWARFVPRETSGFADTPTVVTPARLACSAQVATPSERCPPAASLSPPASPRAPWLRGCRPVKSEATDGNVHDDCAIACVKTSPAAARASRLGLGLGSAP